MCLPETGSGAAYEANRLASPRSAISTKAPGSLKALFCPRFVLLRSAYPDRVPSETAGKYNSKFFPTTYNVGFSCKGVWRGPGVSQGRDERLCRLEALVMRRTQMLCPAPLLMTSPYQTTAFDEFDQMP